MKKSPNRGQSLESGAAEKIAIDACAKFSETVSPPKRHSDSRAKKFEGSSVELDAIPAQQLRQIVRECIERQVDQQQLKLLRIAEESEREVLTKYAAAYAGEVKA
jgi:hypothetical protein